MNWLAQPAWGLAQGVLQGVHHHLADVEAVALLLLAVAAVRVLLAVTRYVHVYWLRPGVDPRYYGAWAVVTGSTDGIGWAYAELLAQRGLNIVLISRSESKLNECAAQLEDRHGVKTHIVVADLCKVDHALVDKISTAIQDLQVGILVNNAGLGPIGGLPNYLEEQPDQFIHDIVSINALVPTVLSATVLPGMRERGRGLIINVGSVIANFDAPLIAAYGATKAFVDNLSRSLDAEYAPLGVRVQNQWAGSVATKMPGIKAASLGVPLPTAWAAAALHQMGHEASITPYWFHAIVNAVMGATPKALLNRQVLRAMSAKRHGAGTTVT